VRRSFSNAIGVSAVTHGAIFLLVLIITSRMPDPASSQRAAPPGPNSIVWIPQAGPGGGGGGGGDRTPDPPRRAEAPGRDRLTVAAPLQNSVNPQPTVVTPPEPSVEIAALPTAAGLTEMPGIITSAPKAGVSLGPGDDGGAGAGRRGGIGPGDGVGLDSGRDKGSGGGLHVPGTNGVSYPRLIREVVPTYTNAALQARIQGVVFMSAVVREDGSVGEVWITRSLDRTFGLDQEAVRTVKQWRFIPAMQAGKPVGAVVPIELQFTIR
jgi:protein TonB